MPPRKDPTPNEYETPRGQRPAVASSIIPSPRAHDPYAAFRSRGFSYFTAGNLLSIMGRQMLAVAVEWEIYARTHSATALGLVGLVFAIPVVTLSLPAGHLADRFSRKRIIQISQVLSAIASAALALVSWKHLVIPQLSILRQANGTLAAIASIFERHHPAFHFDDASVPLIYLLLFIAATVRTFGWAARSSFFPTLVSRDAFANAVTWNNSVFQIGSVVGPAVSGLLVARIGFPVVYMIDALCGVAFFLLVLPIRRSTQTRNRAALSLASTLFSQLSPLICLRCCSAERPRCCRFLRIKFYMLGQSALAGCARRLRSAHLSWRWWSHISGRCDTPADRCFGVLLVSGSRQSFSVCRKCSGSR